MLITALKDREVLGALAGEKIFAVVCHGCKEVRFPEEEVDALLGEWKDEGKLTGVLTMQYICNPENLRLRLDRAAKGIAAADAVMVFSCGVGVQTVAEELGAKKVYAGCDTYPLPGYQGVTPLTVDCDQCGECWLNLTGGICPITACSKSLVNGQCGGAKNGKCEVDPDMPCGWERIYRRLAQLDRLDVFKTPVHLHNFATDLEVGKEA